MILRRLKTHVENENWFAVFLDFAIVVIGLFVGLQINGWHEARQAQQREGLALERLHDEAEEMVRYYQGLIRQFDYLGGMQERVIAYLSGQGEGGLTQGQLEQGLGTLAYYGLLTPPESVYAELNATGGLADVRDRDVRAAIATYRNRLDFTRSQLAIFQTESYRMFEAAGDGLSAVYDPESDDRSRLVVSLEMLSDNQRFLTHAVSSLRAQRVSQTFRRNLLMEAIKLCEATADATGGQCESAALSSDTPR